MPSITVGDIHSPGPIYFNNTESGEIDYYACWQAWENSAAPGSGEFRRIAVQRLLACLESGSETLNLADLELTSLPDALPLHIKQLILSNNQFTQLPTNLPPALASLSIENNPLAGPVYQQIQHTLAAADYQGPVIYAGAPDEAFPLISDDALREVLVDGREIRLKAEDEIRYRQRMKDLLTSRPGKIAGGLLAGVTLLTGAAALFRHYWAGAGSEAPMDNALLSAGPESDTVSAIPQALASAMPFFADTTQPPVAQSVEQRVAAFFRKENLSFIDSEPTKEALASSVAEWLYPPDGPHEVDEKVLKLAKQILLASGTYGGKEGEELSLSMAKGVIRQWVSKLLLGKPLREFVAEKLLADTGQHYMTLGSLKKIISLPMLFLTGQLLLENIPAVKLESVEVMWRALLQAEIPLLDNAQFKEAQNKPLTEYEFLALCAGAQFLADRGELNNFTLQEVAETGAAIWGDIVSGSSDIDMLPWILTPALWYTALTAPDLLKNQQPRYGETAILSVLTQWKNAQQQANTIQSHLTAYQQALDVWDNKGALADKFIARCPLDKIHYIPSRADDILPQAEINKKIRNGAKERYLLYDTPPCQQDNVPPSLTHEYKRVTNNVANNYQQLDRLLLDGALFAANKEDMDFILSPEVKLYAAHLKMRSTTPVMIESPTAFGGATWVGDIYVQLINTELFAIRNNGGERIYGLKKDHETNSYSLLRLDRNIESYIQHGVLSHAHLWDKYTRDGDKLYAHGYEFTPEIKVSTKAPLYTQKNNARDDFLDFFSNKHRSSFYDTLYQAGNVRSATENFWSTLKPIIPFYGCIEGLASGKPAQIVEAIPSCFLDIVSMIPVVGQAASISGKFGMQLAQGMRSGVLKAGQGATAKAIASAVATGIVLPAPAELQSLLINMLRTCDPGIELLFQGGAQIARISAGVSDVGLSARLQQRVSAPANTHKVKYPQAQLPSGNKVSIKKVGEQVWVRVNPSNGEGFGKYYQLEGERLKEIEVHGYPPQDSLPSGSQPQLPVTRALASPVDHNQFPAVPGNAPYWNRVREVSNILPPVPRQRSPDGTIQMLPRFLPEEPLWVNTVETSTRQLLEDVNTYYSPQRWHAWPGMSNDELWSPPPAIVKMQEDLRLQAEQSLRSFQLVWRMIWRIECFGGLPNSQVGRFLAGTLNTTRPEVIQEAFKRLKSIVKRGYKFLKAARDVDFNNMIIISSDFRPDPKHPSRQITSLPRKIIKGDLPFAIVFIQDPEARIFFFADKFVNNIIPGARLRHSLTHEITHAAANTDDIYTHFYPPKGKISNAKDMAIDFSRNFSFKKGGKGIPVIYENIGFRSFLRRIFISQGITGDVPINDIYYAIMTDRMLSANLMMSDADVVATIIRDLAEDRTFDAVIRARREVAPQIDEQNHNATLAEPGDSTEPPEPAERGLQNMLTLAVMASLRAYAAPEQVTTAPPEATTAQ